MSIEEIEREGISFGCSEPISGINGSTDNYSYDIDFKSKITHQIGNTCDKCDQKYNKMRVTYTPNGIFEKLINLGSKTVCYKCVPDEIKEDIDKALMISELEGEKIWHD